MQSLYVVEHFVSLLPQLQVWPLLEETQASYIVKLRDGRRVFKKNATGRRYFLKEEDAVEHLRRAYAEEGKRARRTANRMARLAEAGPKLILDFARGEDEAIMLIEQRSRDLTNARENKTGHPE